MESVEPIWKKSTMLSADARRTLPYTESADPKRDKDRILIVLPHRIASNTLRHEPRRATP
jgi:hypothetical protein